MKIRTLFTFIPAVPFPMAAYSQTSASETRTRLKLTLKSERPHCLEKCRPIKPSHAARDDGAALFALGVQRGLGKPQGLRVSVGRRQPPARPLWTARFTG